jgi:hypothetical protein
MPSPSSHLRVLAQSACCATDVQIVVRYTGSLSEVGDWADTYLDFMRYNALTIVDALK